MRADARRNYDALLTTARGFYLDEGRDAPLEEIARAAGVGIGTLYRHFPSREALLEALYRSEVDAKAELADKLIADGGPGDVVLRTWLREFVEFVMTKRALAAAARLTMNDSAELFTVCRNKLKDTGARVLDYAKADGTIRPDAQSSDVVRMAIGIGHAMEHTPTEVDNLLNLLMDALRYRQPAGAASVSES